MPEKTKHEKMEQKDAGKDAVKKEAGKKEEASRHAEKSDAKKSNSKIANAEKMKTEKSEEKEKRISLSSPLPEEKTLPLAVTPVVDVPGGVHKVDETGVVLKAPWHPKTSLGIKVKKGEMTSLKEVFDSGNKILEAQIVDTLLPDAETVFSAVGQSRGKFGGGKRSIWKQTQKKTCEGNKPKFAILAVIGNKDGYVGMGYGKSKETMPAREKALRSAKNHLIRIRRGCGSWDCNCGEPHSIPFKVSGRHGAAEIDLIPAPKGTGLCVEKECQQILRLAGIKDVYSKSRNKKTKYNLLHACFNALKNMSAVKINQSRKEKTKYTEGPLSEKKME
jgi:small subunit ribosomal protein S5